MRVSIITPTIDAAIFVDEAIASVPHDEGADIEHIIVHDGSAAFVAPLLARYPHLKIIQGPGKGPTPAIRLGYASATGDFVIELNSDDRLLPGAIARLVDHVGAAPDIRIWTGGLRIFRGEPDGTERTLRLVSGRAMTALNFGNVLDDLPLCNSRFFHRSVIAELGGINAEFPESSDREFVLHALIANISEDYLGMVVAELRVHEGSHTLHHKANSIPPYIAEHIRMADYWLGHTGGMASPRAALTSWQARETLRLAVFTWRSGRRAEAMVLIMRAIGRNPAWPLQVISTITAWRRRRRTG